MGIWFRAALVGLLAAAPAALPPAAHAQSQWATYTNVRFAFAVDYPRDIFTGYAEPDNSDGATFKTDAPWVEMRAWGAYNVEKQTPREYAHAPASFCTAPCPSPALA
jgi:hypothetical protein